MEYPAPSPNPVEGGDEKTGALLRLVTAAFRRYARDPETREAAARHLLSASLTLYAEHTTPGEAGLLAAEVLAELGQIERREGRRA